MDKNFCKGGGLAELGRVNIFHYLDGANDSANFDADVYLYNYSTLIRWKFEIRRSTSGEKPKVAKKAEEKSAQSMINVASAEPAADEQSRLVGVSLLNVEECRNETFRRPMTGVQDIMSGSIKRTCLIVKNKTWGQKTACEDSDEESEDEEGEMSQMEANNSRQDAMPGDVHRKDGNRFCCVKCDKPFRTVHRARRHAGL